MYTYSGDRHRVCLVSKNKNWQGNDSIVMMKEGYKETLRKSGEEDRFGLKKRGIISVSSALLVLL